MKKKQGRIAHICAVAEKKEEDLFFCKKCKVKTSGGVKSVESDERFCPSCNSPLVKCSSCQNLISATVLSGKTFCDSCGQEVLKGDTATQTLGHRYLGSETQETPDGHIPTTREVEQQKNRSIEIVLSGIRATSRLHLGNFLGAVRQFVELQQRGNTLGMYFVADWHSLTTLDDPEKIRKNLIEIVKDYLAAGLDPSQSIIYAQSSVPEIAELSLYLSMVQPMGALQNIPTFKDKVREQPHNVNLGLLSYPVLMAADILGPRATLVPVGEDQVPHVELARDIARRFNHRFGNTFIIPEMMKNMIKVPGLDGNKMSKSDSDNTIDIDAPIAEIRDRYMKKGVTDEQRKRREDPGDPYNRCKSIYPVHELVTKGEVETREIATACMGATIGCRECKERLIGSLEPLLGPFQEKRKYFANRDKEVIEILHEGSRRARAVISETVEQVRDKMGIVIYR